ncbi:helix-turn-helix domain-containing protein [Adhaeribacter soli]|uniref:Helix-turn-helix transcriptional regulator n=1 Tax=Adhaeribacter soli TaxID=2607655 RepID=A0A5N1ITW5_9BACT|nr:AraC family transcriptional regulator [Adhaeribacter soli]KAA9333615.1 helix-turn-helix transcriptional regulator [Adhaeribacter soli]
MDLLTPAGSETCKPLYSSQCDLLHIDASYTAGFKDLAENSIISSLYHTYEAALQPKSFGLKYVAEGLESYWFRGKKYQVSGGKYLLVNESVPVVDVRIASAATLGMCVNIEAELLTDVLFQLLHPDDIDSFENLPRYLLSPEILVREAMAGKQLQVLLNKLISCAVSGSYGAPASELIFELVCILVQENLEFINAYYRLKTARLTTRRELFQRLLIGKEMLEESLFTGTSMKQVADTCCLSEFRFYRLFRQAFQVSPYHYLLQKRIEKSLELNKQGLRWSEIAYLLNFTDLAAFSKAFKKVTGVPPSGYSF